VIKISNDNLLKNKIIFVFLTMLLVSTGATLFHTNIVATDINLSAGYLKIGDIKGESTNHKHADQIDILSFSWGVSSRGSSQTPESGQGRAVLSDFMLPRAALNESLSFNISIISSDRGAEYIKYELSSMKITNYNFYQPKDSNPNTEITFTFEKILYKPLLPLEECNFEHLLQLVDPATGEKTDYIGISSYSYRESNLRSDGELVQAHRFNIQTCGGNTGEIFEAMNKADLTDAILSSPARSDDGNYLKWELTDVIISSYSTSAGADNTVPTETISLNFEEIKQTYSESR
jgi:type VI secretion system secreted protein Hcp